MPRLNNRNYSKRQILDLVGDMSQLIHARRAELSEGFERGADLIEVFNASGLGFSILPGRSLDIASAHYKGQSLCFPHKNAHRIDAAIRNDAANVIFFRRIQYTPRAHCTTSKYPVAWLISAHHHRQVRNDITPFHLMAHGIGV